MIGRRSIVYVFKVRNFKEQETVAVRVQMNKNLGICDVYFPINRVQPMKPVHPTKAEYASYKEAKVEYDAYIAHIKGMRQEFLNWFQGRPIHNDEAVSQVRSLLVSLINAE